MSGAKGSTATIEAVCGHSPARSYFGKLLSVFVLVWIQICLYPKSAEGPESVAIGYRAKLFDHRLNFFTGALSEFLLMEFSNKLMI